jgi:hypothetical protein
VKKSQDVLIVATVTLTTEAIYLMTKRNHAYACVLGTFTCRLFLVSLHLLTDWLTDLLTNQLTN